MEERVIKITARVMEIIKDEEYNIQNGVVESLCQTLRDEREKKLAGAEMKFEAAKKIFISTPVVGPGSSTPEYKTPS